MGSTSCSDVVMCLSLWVVSVLNSSEHGGSDPSIVDRLWSICPVLYLWYFALSGENYKTIIGYQYGSVCGCLGHATHL